MGITLRILIIAGLTSALALNKVPGLPEETASFPYLSSVVFTPCSSEKTVANFG